MTYDLSLANIVPVASAFTIMVNYVARTVITVTIAGTKVRLTLASPVVSGDIVTLSYTKPATNPLQIQSGGQAVNLSSRSITNNVSAIPVYLSSDIQNTSPDRLEMTYDLNLANIIPAASAFTVMVNSVARPVNMVTISGTMVILTLNSPVVSGDIVTVAYTKPLTNQLRTVSGGQATSFPARSVNNNLNVIPLYVSSVILNSTPNMLRISFDQQLAKIIPPVYAFTVLVNNVENPVTRVTISTNTVILTLKNPVTYGDSVTVEYIKPENNPVQTPSGGTALTFPALTVTNALLKSPKHVDNKSGSISIYPNPASDYVNVQIMETTIEPQMIRFYDFSGRICQENRLDPYEGTIRIPLELKPGLYIVKVISGKLIISSQTLIIVD